MQLIMNYLVFFTLFICGMGYAEIEKSHPYNNWKAWYLQSNRAIQEFDWKVYRTDKKYEKVVEMCNAKMESEVLNKKFMDLTGIKTHGCYVIPCQNKLCWLLIDEFGCMVEKFLVIYSSNRIVARQAGVSRAQEREIPYFPKSDLQEWKIEDEFYLLSSERRCGNRILYTKIVEKNGFVIWNDKSDFINPDDDKRFVAVAKELIQILSGEKKPFYSKVNANLLYKWLNRDCEHQWQSRYRFEKWKELQDILSSQKHLQKAISELEILKNEPISALEIMRHNLNMSQHPNKGVGNTTWMNEHVNLKFIQDDFHHQKDLGDYCNSGVIEVSFNRRTYPIWFEIHHMDTRACARGKIFDMMSDELSFSVKGHYYYNYVPLSKDAILRITQCRKDLVGDCALCLLPQKNELGQKMEDMEYSWICFTRGKTAVLLKDPEMSISVLPLAKLLDKALIKGIQESDKKIQE